MESIKPEARRNSKISLDLENFRSRYIEYDTDNDLEVIFPALEIATFEKNFFVLLSDSKKVKFEPSWEMRPDYVSSDFYKTTVLWPLILFVNRINSIEDFTGLDEVLIPPYNKIIEILKDRVSKTEITILETESEVDTSKYKIYPLDDKELAKKKADEALI
ncbi:MAG: hypothetical protein KAS32_16180 [Candidatus Peribacteraceae bacterium]|nr:hypothetical protein [Candidatus Peribacteraceae bacterium]